MKKLLLVAVCGALLPLGGCWFTDELLVFPDQRLTQAEMNSYLGEYALQPREDQNLAKGVLTMERKEDGCRLAFETVGENGDTEQYAGEFSLGRIPGPPAADASAEGAAKDQTALLLSMPKVKADRTTAGERKLDEFENFFCLVKREEGQLRFWFVDGNSEVAQGRVHYIGQTGQFPVEEMRKFLQRHADEYTAKNQPIFTFVKQP